MKATAKRTAESIVLESLRRQLRENPEQYAAFLATPCDYCQAKAGEVCMTSSGKAARWHVPRVIEANKAIEANDGTA